MIRILLVAAVACLLGCAFGGVDKEGAWGVSLGNAKITNCLTETELDRVQKVDPDGAVIESSEKSISKVTENCYTVAGAAISEQGQSVVSTIFAPIRWIGGALGGSAP